MRYYCNKCNRNYKHRNTLNLHQRVECGKPPTQVCMVCQKRFHRKGNLFQHMVLVHKLSRN